MKQHQVMLDPSRPSHSRIKPSLMQKSAGESGTFVNALQSFRGLGSVTTPDAVNEAMCSPGHQIDSSARALMESSFGHHFSRVRVHTDDRAAELAQELNTRAFTVGNDIAFGAGQYGPTGSDGRELLWHELVHVVQNRGDTRYMSMWNKDEHHRITQYVTDFYRKERQSAPVMRDPLFGSAQFHRIVDASFDMDVTAKRILWTGPRFLMSKVPIISILGTKGEGPEHGEDGNYSKEGKDGGVSEAARSENVKLQTEYVQKSLEYYRREVTPQIARKGGGFSVEPPVRHFANGKIQVTPNVVEMLKALGNACHIAQDRGAHWEGTKGMGHDDPRTREGSWNPDNPMQNGAGYVAALQNTYRVFRMWESIITNEIGVPHW